MNHKTGMIKKHKMMIKIISIMKKIIKIMMSKIHLAGNFI